VRKHALHAAVARTAMHRTAQRSGCRLQPPSHVAPCPAGSQATDRLGRRFCLRSRSDPCAARAPPAQNTPWRPPVRGRGQGRVAPDHGRLHTRAVRGERGFHLGGAHAVAGHVDDVVHAARDGVVPARVALAAVAGEVQALRRARRFSGRPATPCSLCARPTGAAVVAAPGSGATRRGLAAYRAPMHHVPPNVPNTCNTPPDTAS